MESVYEYGARAGFWRLHRLLRDLPVTIYGVASALARSPAQVAAMQDAGWEIASHGLRWIDYRNHTPEAERADLEEAIRLHTEVTGEPPKGWYTGRTSAQTVDLVSEAGIFDWVADTYDDDLPYWREHGDRQQLIIPYTLETNDMRFSAGTFHTSEDFFTYLRDTFDTLYAEGEAGAPKMMSVGLHCRLIGRPGRIKGLADFLTHIQASPTSGSPPAATSPPTGAPATRPRPSPTAPPASPRTPSSSATAASSSIPPGSPSAPSTSSSAPPTTPPPASPAPSPAPSAPPPPTSASPSSRPTPTSPASWRRRNASPPNPPPNRPAPASTP